MTYMSFPHFVGVFIMSGPLTQVNDFQCTLGVQCRLNIPGYNMKPDASLPYPSQDRYVPSKAEVRFTLNSSIVHFL